MKVKGDENNIIGIKGNNNVTSITNITNKRINYGKLEKVIYNLVNNEFKGAKEVDYLIIEIKDKIEKNNLDLYKEKFDIIEPYTEEIEEILITDNNEKIVIRKIQSIYISLKKKYEGDELLENIKKEITNSINIDTIDIDFEIEMLMWHVFLKCQILEK